MDNVTCDYVARTPRGEVQCGEVASADGRCASHAGPAPTPIREGNGAKADANIPVPAERLDVLRDARGEALRLEARLGAVRIQYLADERAIVEAQAKAIDQMRAAERRLRNGANAPPDYVLDLAGGCFRPRRPGE